jgi:hypothetical protein
MKTPADKPTLDDAIQAVREDEPPAGAAEAAAARVWARIASETGIPAAEVAEIRSCADVRALFGEHRQGTLKPARALLVEDHLRECAACRAAFRQPDRPRLAVLPWRASAETAARPERFDVRRFAVAASVLLAVGASAFATWQLFYAPPPGSRAAVQSVSGMLQRVAAQSAPALRPGDEVGEAEPLRTASGAHALLRLFDGSVVEMDERAELEVTARGKDTTIHLKRGNIIIQAAKRRTGRLMVASRDCTVYVTGTTFSVNHGLKGSRVSVIEGNVQVVRGTEKRRLQPGEQWTSGSDMGAVPLEHEIGWSKNLSQHLALLGELQALRAQWDRLAKPGLRYESRLLSLFPEGAVVFASVPNYGQTLADAHRLFQERLQQSPVLQEWWADADPARHGGPPLATVIDKLRGFAEYLGGEIALAVVDRGVERRRFYPVFLAEVRRPGLREFLEGELRETSAAAGRRPGVQIIDETGAVLSNVDKSEVVVLLRPDLIAISPDKQGLTSLAQLLDASGGLARTEFGQRIEQAYRDGVGFLFAADLERIRSSKSGLRSDKQAEVQQRAGIDGVRHLIVERKDLASQGSTRALLSFTGPRRGIASWLAAPAPMGALSFVSPGAQAVGAFVLKSPALVLDDVLNIAESKGPRALQEFQDLESKLSLRIREDLAEALGGEFALALDGPLLPTPAWKVVHEVYDPARVQTALQVLVTRANEEAVRDGRPGVQLESEQVGAQTFHVVRAGFLPFELHYAFADGYLVAAPSRALVMQAIRTHESGENLGRSAALRSLFPADGQDHVSALLYQNFGPLMRGLLDAANSAPLTDEQRGAFEAIARDAKPALLCAYGEEDAIRLAGSGGLLNLNPSDLALPMLLQRALPGTARRAIP